MCYSIHMKYQVLRLDKSPYLDGNFTIREKSALENGDISYVPNVYELNSECRYFLITNTHTNFERIPEIVLDRTELLVHPNSGYDNINESFVKKSTVPVIVGNPIRAGAVTEFILSAITNHYSPIEHHIYWKGMRKWNRGLLESKTALVIGAGNIGFRVISSLKHLCHQVNYIDPYSEFLPPIKELTNEMIATADIVLLCSELNQSTRHLMNKERIEQMKEDVLFINTARGELVDETALMEFLEKNALAKAFLDVFEKEPFDPGLGNHLKNLNKTSHIAGVYQDLQNRMIAFEQEIIHSYLTAKKNNTLDSFWEKYSHLHYQKIRQKRGF